MKSHAFTLIELLVVISIIGLLSSIVLGSLNTAREKAKIAAIKGNLRNMVPQMELSYSNNGNYSGINATGVPPYQPSTVCTGPIAGMAQSISKGGAKARCLSTNVSGWQDVNKRWGATALISTATTPVKAWSVSPTGVVAWDVADLTSADLPGGNAKSWADAMSACVAKGARLPTVEELKTLADAQCEALGSADCTIDSQRDPPGFQAAEYWSSTEVPSDSSSAYFVIFDGGSMSDVTKTLTLFARCVR